MTEKQAYSYTVLRYIHDVVSGETLNVGVVMHAPAVGFLKARAQDGRSPQGGVPGSRRRNLHRRHAGG